MNKLHPTQKRLLELLKKTINDPLTIRELQEELGVSSPSVIHHHILQLVKRGYLKRNPSNPNDYQVIFDSPESSIVYLNLYGLAQCGPKGKIIDGNPIDRIPISSRILSIPAKEAFLVRAKGDSMTPKIHDKDLVIVQKANFAENGSIVVCVNKGEALIKKIQSHDKMWFLVSTNNNYTPFPAADDFQIEGIVKGVISYSV
jgi:repressor LexA